MEERYIYLTYTEYSDINLPELFSLLLLILIIVNFIEEKLDTRFY